MPNGNNNTFDLGGVLSGIGSIAGSVLGIGSTLINNAQSQENFNEQMNFARYQYEDSKKYNSMQEQVKRMRAAGINPALAISQGQLGTAASSVGQPSAPSFDSVPAGDLMQGVSSLVSSSSQNRHNIALSEREEINNQYLRYKNIGEILTLQKELEKRGIDNKLLDEELKRSIIRTGQYTKELSSNRELAQKQANYYDSLQLINQEKLNWLPQEKRAAILVAASEHYKNYATGKASLEEASAATRQSLKQNGIYFKDKKQEDDYVDAVIDAMAASGYVDFEQQDSYGVKAGPTGIGSNGNRKRTLRFNPRKKKQLKFDK